jgi:hypothetical protein
MSPLNENLNERKGFPEILEMPFKDLKGGCGDVFPTVAKP